MGRFVGGGWCAFLGVSGMGGYVYCVKGDFGEVVLRRLVVLVVVMLVAGVVGSGAVSSEPAVGQATPESGLCDAGATAQFGDVGDADYGAAYILCMRALGLSQGRSDGDFGPGRELNRGQMATFLIRLWTEQLGRQCPTGVVVPFTDTQGTTHEANIECLFGLGITQGTSATTYGPGDPLTASQISRFLYRTYQTAGGDQCAGTDGSERDRAAECLVGLRVAPTTGEATSAAAVTRAQMGVYVIGLWHNLTGKGLPPVPPQLPTTTTTTTTTPAATVPGEPFIWRALQGNGRILIEWSAPADDGGSPITGYTVSFDNGRGHSGKLTVSDTMATISDLTNDATYTIKVTADNTLGSSPPAATTLVPSETNTVPGPPVLRVTQDRPDWVSVEWGPPADDGGSPVLCYYISYNGGPADDWCNTSNNQFSINLEAGVTYTFEATASNRFGSGWPARATIVPTGTLVPSENPDAEVSSIGPRRGENNERAAEADFLAVDEVAGRHAADTGWLAALEGTLAVPVFICGPTGQYAADDVRQVTAELNSRLGGFFHRLTSGRIDVVFSEGAAINIDQDFEAARAFPRDLDLGDSILRECDRGVDDASDVNINLIISEFNPCGCEGGCAYLGGNSYVDLHLIFPLGNRGVHVVAHELVHSVLRLHHLKNYGFGNLLIDEVNLALYGPEGYWNSLTRPPLADYQYKLLGWPVPEGYSEPPAKLSPSGPSILWADTTDDGEITIMWSPPHFVDAPITGYTVEIRIVGGGTRRQELPANARTATLRLPNAAAPAGYELGLWANSPDANHRNNNNPVESESETVGSRGDLALDLIGDPASVARSSGRGSFIHFNPPPPRVEEVSVSDITSSTVELTWDAEELIRYETEHKTDGARQFHYQIDYIASDLPDEDPTTTCPPVPVRQGQWTEQAVRSLSAVTGCNPTNWVRGDTAGYPNGVFTYRTRETFSGGRVVVDAEVFGLDPSTRYTFRVRTCNDFSSLSCSQWRTATASTVGSSTLPPPSGIRIASGNDEVFGDSTLVPWALATWDPVPGAAAYEIEVVNEDVTFAEGRRVAHSFDLSGDLQVSDSQEIVFRIRSCKILFRGACGDGEWATVSVPKPTDQDIPPPYGISVKEVSDASTKLDYWVPGSANHHPYTLEYQYTDGTSDSGLQHQGRVVPIREASDRSEQ